MNDIEDKIINRIRFLKEEKEQLLKDYLEANSDVQEKLAARNMDISLELQFLEDLNNTQETNLILLAEVLALANPYTLKDVLTKLIRATEYLLNEKDYDGTDYEELGICVQRAKETIDIIKQSL